MIRVISTDKTKAKSEIAWTGIFSQILSISLRTALAILKEVLGMRTSKPCHFSYWKNSDIEGAVAAVLGRSLTLNESKTKRSVLWCW